MGVDGVNKVTKDGRYKLPPELAEKYSGDYMSASERGSDGKIVLKRVSDDE